MASSTGTSQLGKSSAWVVVKFKQANTGKRVLLKILLLLLVGCLVIIPSFVVRAVVLRADPFLTTDTPFIHFTAPIANAGVAWSGLADADPSLIIFLQFFPVLIGVLVLVWLRKWWTIFPVLLFVLGGLCNFVDRFVDDPFMSGTTTNTVVDYLQFAGRTEVFNLPDAFIIVGAGLTVVAIVFNTFIGLFKKTPVPVKT